jgi:hydroxyacylglutathione hydrolase
MNPVLVLPALGDNYIYLLPYAGNQAVVIDPADAAPVLSALKKHNLQLTTILVTHHHVDHTAGIRALKQKTYCTAWGPDSRRTPDLDRQVTDNDFIDLPPLRIRIMATPGHTSNSVCYYIETGNAVEKPLLFTGDTLFIGGCGRIHESDARQMWNSLQRLAELPDNSLVYPGHDYTRENYEFALTIDPDNQVVRQRLADIRTAEAKRQITVPNTIAGEKQTNIFLRSQDPQLKSLLALSGDTPPDRVFADLRERKNRFG